MQLTFNTFLCLLVFTSKKHMPKPFLTIFYYIPVHSNEGSLIKYMNVLSKMPVIFSTFLIRPPIFPYNTVIKPIHKYTFDWIIKNPVEKSTLPLQIHAHPQQKKEMQLLGCNFSLLFTNYYTKTYHYSEIRKFRNRFRNMICTGRKGLFKPKCFQNVFIQAFFWTQWTISSAVSLKEEI